MERHKKCSLCKDNIKFFGSNNSFIQKKYCFDCLKKRKSDCDRAYRNKKADQLKIKKREYYYFGGKEKKCKVCEKSFFNANSLTRYCSRKCFHEESKESRKGTNNPAYRNGTRVKGRSVSWRHLDATRKYGKDFLEKHGYKYCENCGINQSLRFETHHIVFASEMPRHKELHNVKNLILVCIKCHNDFHSGKTHEKRIELVKERGLVEIFGKTIL
jgi:hypothetical protein